MKIILSKKLIKESHAVKNWIHVTTFDYIDKILIVLSGATGGVLSLISFTSVIRAPVGIASASFTLIFSLTTGIVKKLLNITRKKRKSMIKFLWLQLDSNPEPLSS